MKKRPKKLVLTRETLRRLQMLGGVAPTGGCQPSYDAVSCNETTCPGGQNTCVFGFCYTNSCEGCAPDTGGSPG